MENIYIEHTFHTPEVYFDKEEYKLHFVGKSYPGFFEDYEKLGGKTEEAE